MMLILQREERIAGFAGSGAYRNDGAAGNILLAHPRRNHCNETEAKGHWLLDFRGRLNRLLASDTNAHVQYA